MTVAELIAYLSKLDGDLPVFTPGLDEDGFEDACASTAKMMEVPRRYTWPTGSISYQIADPAYLDEGEEMRDFDAVIISFDNGT